MDEPSKVPQWLAWAREIEALAQTGLHYARNDFERQRAERMLEIASEIVARYSSLPQETALDAFRAQPGYVTPKVDVRVAVVRNGQLLLVQEALDGGWTLPGGWADVGESPRQAAEREVCEESGFQVQVKRLIGVYDANLIAGALDLFHAYKCVFLGEVVSGEARPSPETLAVGFFPFDALPEPFSPHRTKPRHIADVLAALDDPDCPTVFD